MLVVLRCIKRHDGEGGKSRRLLIKEQGIKGGGRRAREKDAHQRRKHWVEISRHSGRWGIQSGKSLFLLNDCKDSVNMRIKYPTDMEKKQANSQFPIQQCVLLIGKQQKEVIVFASHALIKFPS